MKVFPRVAVAQQLYVHVTVAAAVSATAEALLPEFIKNILSITGITSFSI